MNRSGLIKYLFSCGLMMYGLSIQAQTFEEVSAATGLVHQTQMNILMGGGVAILDYNNDGWEDVYITGGDKQDRLFKNNGDGTFTDVSVQAGLSFTANLYTIGVAAGDIDNDGYRDIFVTTGKDLPDILLKNNGDGTFTDIAAQAGVDAKDWGMSVSFGDVNKDGWLDIYIANYIVNQYFIYDVNNNIVGYDPECAPNYLFINQGNGTFVESAGKYGVADYGCGLATAFTDFDNDGDVDVLTANDFGEWHIGNRLFENDYPIAAMNDRSQAVNYDDKIYGMGIAVGDINNDLHKDYYVTNLGRNVLLQADSLFHFVDVTTAAGVEDDTVNGAYATGWSTFFFDYDNDGYQDLFVNNGQIPSGVEFTVNAERNPNKLYRNNGNGTFTDVSEAAGIADEQMGRGAAFFDFDHDGDLDIISVVIARDPNSKISTRFFRNQSAGTNHWVELNLIGTKSNINAIGSLLEIYAKGLQTVREIDGGSSHVSHNSTTAHFGLGITNQVDSLRIKWISGKRHWVYGLPTDTLLTIAEDTVAVEMSKVNCDSVPNELTLTGPRPGNVYYLFDLATQTIVGNKIVADGNPITFSTGRQTHNKAYQVRFEQNGLPMAVDSVFLKKVRPDKVELQVNGANVTVVNEHILSYQWYKNGTPVEGEKNLTMDEPGLYWVELKDMYGCEMKSDTIDFTITGLTKSEITDQLMPYPNPSTGLFYVHHPLVTSIREALVLDVTGRVVEATFTWKKREETFCIDLSDVPAGIYKLSIFLSNTHALGYTILKIPQ